MLGDSVNPLTQWPRIRRLKPGRLRVQGRCISSGQWFILRAIGSLTVLLLLISVLAAAMLPWTVVVGGYLSDTNPISGWIGLLSNFRGWLRSTLTEDFPAVGQALFYTGTNPFDWHLLGVWLALFWLRRPMGFTVASGLAKLLGPLLGRGFSVSFTREAVIIHRWLGLGSKTLRRHMAVGGEVTFRAAPPQYQGGTLRWLMLLRLLQPGQDNELVLVQAVAGLRPVTIATPRKMLDAEKIVQSMQLAMQHSRNMME